MCLPPLLRCRCALGYRGHLCEVDIDECDPNPCVNGASCLDGLGSYTCRCLPGFNGTRCETGTIGQVTHHHGNCIGGKKCPATCAGVCASAVVAMVTVKLSG